MTQWVKNPTSTHEDESWIPGPMALLWLWCRLAAPTWIQPLAWKLTHAASEVLKRIFFFF